MFGRAKSEVLIVGAGPVGLFTALLLKQRGVRVEIIDAAPGTDASSDAPALHPSTLRMLDDAGVVSDLLEAGVRLDRVTIHDRDRRRAEVLLGALESEHPYLLALPQSVLERVLEDKLRGAGVRVGWNTEVRGLTQQGERVTVEVDDIGTESLGYGVAATVRVVSGQRRIEVPWVIGADGHHSRVRRAIGVEQDTFGTPQTYAAFEFLGDAGAASEVRMVLDGDRRAVLWPLGPGRWRWSFELSGAEAVQLDDRRKAMVAPAPDRVFDDPKAELLGLLRDRVPWFDGRVDTVVWANLVPFERRLARHLGKGRVWLAGDAGHVAGPIGVHGMNVGLHEGHELAWRLAGVLRGHARAEELAHYDGRRRAEWRFLLGQQGGLAAGPGADPWVASHALDLLACLPVNGADLGELARQLGLEAVGNLPELR